jgi:hypothetical protein
VSTITIERPNVVQTLSEWRRICHIYEGDLEIAVCGTAVRKRERSTKRRHATLAARDGVADRGDDDE